MSRVQNEPPELGARRLLLYGRPNDGASGARPSNLTGRLRAGNPPGLAWAIPIGIAAVYLVIFLLQLHHNIKMAEWFSDYSSPFTVIETLVRTGPGDHTLLGTSGQYITLWFGLLTAKLPLHRELWAIMPTLAFIAMALLVGWSVSQVSHRFAGALAALLILVASPKVLIFVLGAVAHNISYLATALVGAYLVWLTRAEERRRAVALTVPPLAGLGLGLCVGSDLLGGAAAVLPLLITAVLAGLRRGGLSRSVALSALTTALIAIPVAVITIVTMDSLGLRVFRTPLEMPQLSLLRLHAELFFEGLRALFNGYLDSGSPGILHSVLGEACEILMPATLLVVLIAGVRTTIGFRRSRSPLGNSETPKELATSLHIIYWVTSGVAVCAAFLLTAETGTTETHESYYAPTILTVAAVLPLLLARRALARWLILAVSAIFFAASLAGLASGNVKQEFAVRAATYAPEVVRLAEANHVSVGYAGYWEASSLTWNTNGKVTIRPVMECATPEGASFCPFLLERVTSWYSPQNRHTFMLVDSAEGWLANLPPGLGQPLASYAFGTVRMLIYPYDIASRLGPYTD
jgi:hypothetical protein